MIKAYSIAVEYPGGHCALAPASAHFRKGSFTVLLGPSGAGKSTLLRCLNGLVRPSQGRVVVEGVGNLAIKRNLRAHRRQTGMIFQQHHLIGRQTVLDNVLMGRLGYHSGPRTLLGWSMAEKRLALEAVARVDLLDHALRRADRLSGGQQQRIGIARALVQEPRLILADEPVASLDPATARKALGLLHAICKADGLTAIVSLHQVEFARTFADRIVGLRAGRVVFDGAPGDLDDDACATIYGQAVQPTEEATDYPQQRTGTYA